MTSAYPSVLVSLPSWMGAPGRFLGNVITGIALRASFGPAVRHIRTQVLGLPARPAPIDPRLPAVHGYSPLVVPPAPEWGTSGT